MTENPPVEVTSCSSGDCENMKCTYEGFDGERYRCAICGKSYFLDYEDMK